MSDDVPARIAALREWCECKDKVCEDHFDEYRACDCPTDEKVCQDHAGDEFASCSCPESEMGYYHEEHQRGTECPVCQQKSQHAHCGTCEKILGYS